MNPEGVFLSNGPGDPAALEYAHEAVRGLIGKRPLFGICLGHQILALAFGGKTFKLKFGHRGANQPVKDLRTGKGRHHIAEPRLRRGSRFACRSDVEVTHINLNDGTVAGLATQGISGLQRPISPRSLPRASRCIVFLRRIRQRG